LRFNLTSQPYWRGNCGRGCVSGEQLGTGWRELHIGARIVAQQPAQRDCAGDGGAELVRSATLLEEGAVDKLDEDAAVLDRLNRVGDLHQLAGCGVEINEVAWFDEFHGLGLP